MNYFIWTFNPTIRTSWFLSEPFLATGDVVDSWNFKKCERYKIENALLTKTKYEDGDQSEVSFGAFDLVYASAKLASAIANVSNFDVQLIPVRVDGNAGEFFLINVLAEIKCIDENRSNFSKWEVGNSVRPDKAGQYSGFFKLFINPASAESHHIFRPWGWHVALIVSEILKFEIEKIGAGDTIFIPAS